MARAKKLWRLLKVWHRHEWVPFATAWTRAEQVVGPGSHARYELQRAFRGKQLVAAVQLIAEDGAETWVALEHECWRWLQVDHAWSISGWRLLPGWWKAEGGPEDRQRGGAAAFGWFAAGHGRPPEKAGDDHERATFTSGIIRNYFFEGGRRRGIDRKTSIAGRGARSTAHTLRTAVAISLSTGCGRSWSSQNCATALIRFASLVGTASRS